MKAIVKKITVALFLFGSLFIMSACQKKSDFIEPVPLRIIFVSYFSNEKVTVKLDERTIFDDRLITWPVWKEDFTHSFHINAPVGMRTISIEIIGEKKIEKFLHEKDRVILVNYSKTSPSPKIHVQVTHESVLL